MAGNLNIKNANGKTLTIQNPDTNNADIVIDGSKIASTMSPALTGNPTATTQTAGDNSTKLATTAYVDGKMVLSTAVTASGTAIDFTSIPSWVKKIKIIFKSVSTNGTDLPFIQLGDSGGIETTGYESGAFCGVNGNVVTAVSYNTGIVCTGFGNAGYLISGQVELVKFSGNIWVSAGNLSQLGLNSAGSSSAGCKELSSTLDRIRITTINGTDTFDAGSINIMYEG